MKLSLTVLLSVVVASLADEQAYYDDDAIEEYEEEYYENYDSEYVEDMNEGNGNFQYYDADGQYDEDYQVTGYYDDYGNWVTYSDDDDGSGYGYGDDTYVDDANAEYYYDTWQEYGGADGYYDNDGDWNTNVYYDAPCLGYQSNPAYDYSGQWYSSSDYGYNRAWNNSAYDGSQVYDYDSYLQSCDEELDIRVGNCKNSVIEVKDITIICDSPFRYYYGTGGRMSSELCEYGDNALVIVYFDVHKNLDYMKNSLYMTLGIYANKQNKTLLWKAEGEELCNNFVGKDCTSAGSYGFAFDVSFDSGTDERALFVPMVEMGFSTRPDSGYNLGGVNIDCDFNVFYQQYNPWRNGKTAEAAQTWGAGGLGVLGGNYGFIIGGILLVIAVGLHTHTRAKEGIEFQGNAEELIGDKTQGEPDQTQVTI
eukprot:Nitzschia sp. Nitz4//scaffold195_size40117//34902//36167//NITZ4_007581-RA/size40117-processed-gene-0.18-mRNA-1//1//CDS//3329540380//3217//frame0